MNEEKERSNKRHNDWTKNGIPSIHSFSLVSLRMLFGFGQSAPAITIALRKAFQGGVLNPARVNFT
jgi:hypothetical protein